MSYIGSNIVSILTATIVGLLIGVAFRAISGQPWESRGPNRLIVLSIVAAVAEFWLASILAGALILAPVQADAWTIAIGTAVVIWIGFVLPTFAVSYYARGLRSVIVVDCTHWLAVMLGQAAVLKLVGLVRP